MYKKILVPLDGSEMAECSLEQAKAIALGCHVPEVVILSVIEPSAQGVPFLWGGAGEAQRQDAKEIEKDREQLAKMDKSATATAVNYVKKVADGLVKDGVNAKTEVKQGKAADTILEYANKNNFDLVIMSSHGHSGKSHFDFGKITDKIIHSSNIPVIITSPPGCRI